MAIRKRRCHPRSILKRRSRVPTRFARMAALVQGERRSGTKSIFRPHDLFDDHPLEVFQFIPVQLGRFCSALQIFRHELPLCIVLIPLTKRFVNGSQAHAKVVQVRKRTVHAIYFAMLKRSKSEKYVLDGYRLRCLPPLSSAESSRLKTTRARSAARCFVYSQWL